MRAALLREVGGPFELGDVPEPAVEGKVLVRVRAAGVNFADVLVRRGRYPQMPELPAVLGSEIAGELEDGTRVMAITSGGGGYAELAAVERATLVPLPDAASFAEGASFLLTFLTAYIPLTRQVHVDAGSTVIVYAGAGGVGSATIQVARALGARVVAAVGSHEKLDVCRELGAEEAYVYEELPAELRADVVFDPVGGELFSSSFARLRPLGSVVAIGSAAGAWTEVDPARLVGRNVGIHGFYLGRLLRHDPSLVHAALAELLSLWQTAGLRPLVGAELPLDRVEQAHELLESRRSVGKVVLVPVTTRALITGGRGGIGTAIAAALGDVEVVSLDLADGFDVADPSAWRSVEGEFDAAFLNAGVTTGEVDVAELTDSQYRRALGANVDGVVLGTRELAARLMPHGGSIVATASLAGLTATPIDPIYALTKHAVVGFVRSVAPQLAARGIRISALCPGFTDTPIVADELRSTLPAPLMEPSFVAEAALRALADEETGRAWIVQPNRIEPYRYAGIPGPR